MSLDVYLTDAAGNELFSGSLVSGLSRMAEEAGIYTHLWFPERLGIVRAGELVEPLSAALERLNAEPERFEAFNAITARWGGTRHDFALWLHIYCRACREHPEAVVRACD